MTEGTLPDEAMFRCPDCKTVTFGPATEDKIQCRECGSPYAIRTVGAPTFTLEGVSGDYPTALQKWEKRHSKSIRTED
jgi:hypothetical protein